MNVSPRVVAALRGAGWDAIRVSERLPATSPDEEDDRERIRVLPLPA